MSLTAGVSDSISQVRLASVMCMLSAASVLLQTITPFAAPFRARPQTSDLAKHITGQEKPLSGKLTSQRLIWLVSRSPAVKEC